MKEIGWILFACVLVGIALYYYFNINRRKKPCYLMETWLFSGFLNLSSVDVIMDFLKLPREGQPLR